MKLSEERANQINTIIDNQTANAVTLIDKTRDLTDKFKKLNEQLKELLQYEKDLKLKEMLNANKKVELMSLERRIKEKNSMYYKITKEG